MDRLIVFLSFVPWLLYFVIYGMRAISDVEKLNDNNKFKWLKTHIFQIFRLDNLVLILVFYYFLKHHNNLVDKMLFSAINLYLFVSSLYDKPFREKGKLLRNHSILWIIVGIILIIPFGYYFRTNNLQETYKLMFAYTFFAYLMFMLARRIEIFFRNLNK